MTNKFRKTIWWSIRPSELSSAIKLDLVIKIRFSGDCPVKNVLENITCCMSALQMISSCSKQETIVIMSHP